MTVEKLSYELWVISYNLNTPVKVMVDGKLRNIKYVDLSDNNKEIILTLEE